ncbi:MAG: hypothetical protein GY861_12955, partial [bacterium]|nr:hypothetical protein [bacterium]
MKLDTLISTMKKHQISLPNGGTGLNGRVISADLEHALGSHFLETKY